MASLGGIGELRNCTVQLNTAPRSPDFNRLQPSGPKVPEAGVQL